MSSSLVSRPQPAQAAPASKGQCAACLYKGFCTRFLGSNLGLATWSTEFYPEKRNESGSTFIPFSLFFVAKQTAQELSLQ